jgi:hypothetical protein
MGEMKVGLTLNISLVAGFGDTASDIRNECLGSADALNVHEAATLGEGTSGA